MTPVLSVLLLTGCSPDRLRSIRTTDGLARTFRLHMPVDHDGATDVPLVMVLHGGGGDADGAMEQYGMNELADKEGFAVLYPNGTGEKKFGQGLYTWNADVCCDPAVADGVDDVAFIGELLDRVEARWTIDMDRVYTTGISNGGIMSSRLAMQLSDRIAAAAPVASPGPSTDWATLSPTPIQIVHGTSDGCALYDGGDVCGGCFVRILEDQFGFEAEDDGTFPCTSVADQVSAVVETNGCSGEVTTTFESGAASCVAYTCTEAAFEVCLVEDGGHNWPGESVGCDTSKSFCSLYEEATGPFTTDMKAEEQMWRFFSAQSLE